MRCTALLVCVLLAGCERKAPGPVECVTFARQALGNFTTQAAHDELVQRCLTTPYPRTLLQCVDRTGDLRTCRHILARGMLENP
ncbi:MAG TPA: hypothetical protein VM686_10380 [Polyangiaceae bacterium]|nr:hypothetical protein [Polyangiaceae bacterium]